MADNPFLSNPAIIGKTAKSTGYRARDVRADIKEMGFEKGVERALTLIADENVGLRQTVAELAGIVDKLIDMSLQGSQVTEQVVKQIDVLRMRDEKYNALDQGS